MHGDHARIILGERLGDLDRFFSRQRDLLLELAGDHGGERAGASLDVGGLALQARQYQHLRHQVGGPVDAANQSVQRLGPLDVVPAALRDLGVGADGGERGSQLM